MLFLNEEFLKNLQEIQFNAGEGEEGGADDYALPDDVAEGGGGEDTPAEEDAPADDVATEEETPTEEEETPEEGEENTEEEPTEDEEGTDDYTMDGEEGETPEEGGEDTEETPTEEEETPTEEEENPSSANDMTKKKRLLTLYKKFYTDLSSLSDNIGERIAPLSTTEEYLYKVIVENIDKNKKLMYEYIENLYNNKGYEENIYQFYYFSSQVEMIHILLRKIKTYRDNIKNNIIKK